MYYLQCTFKNQAFVFFSFASAFEFWIIDSSYHGTESFLASLHRINFMANLYYVGWDTRTYCEVKIVIYKKVLLYICTAWKYHATNEIFINNRTMIVEILTMLRASLPSWFAHFNSRLHLQQNKFNNYYMFKAIFKKIYTYNLSNGIIVV